MEEPQWQLEEQIRNILCLLPPQSWSRGRVRGCMMYLMVRRFCRDNIVEMVATATRRNCLPTPSLGRCSRSKTCIVSTSNLISSPDPASTLDNLAWYPGCVGGEKCFSLPRWPGTRLVFNSNLLQCLCVGTFSLQTTRSIFALKNFSPVA